MSKLQDMRKSRGMSQSQLAELSEISIRMIQYYEQGVRDINKAQGITLRKLANVLSCAMEDLMEDENEG